MAKRIETKDRPAAGTRDRMVAGTADLLRRRGVTATSLREVVRHTGTPRGSLAHHFPNGKAQLLEEAVIYSRMHVSRPLQKALDTLGAVKGLRAFVTQWSDMLEATRFEAGCPVMAVAIEHNVDEVGAHLPTQQRLLDLAQQAFEEWAGLIATALQREGLPPAQAHSLAVLIIAAFEGAIGMSRAARSCQPINDVGRQLELIITNELR